MIRVAFAKFLEAHSIDRSRPSVWIRPQYNSTFKPGTVID
jgi:hypothetical protein